jgi:hypothetical protein
MRIGTKRNGVGIENDLLFAMVIISKIGQSAAKLELVL